jgi:hypothetical protein
MRFQTYLIVGSDEEERLNHALMLRDTYKGKDVDTIIVGQEGVIKIEDARSITSVLSRTPYNSPITTIILNEMDNATAETQHALLKTLEEPPDFALIIMTAQTKESVIPTILSRSLVVPLTRQTEFKHDAAFIENLRVILSGSPGMRFSYGSRIAVSKEEASVWLEKCVHEVRFLLLSNINTLSSPEKKSYTSFLHLSSRAFKTVVTTNTNHRLLMENLLLALPSLP